MHMRLIKYSHAIDAVTPSAGAAKIRHLAKYPIPKPQRSACGGGCRPSFWGSANLVGAVDAKRFHHVHQDNRYSKILITPIVHRLQILRIVCICAICAMRR